MKKPAVLLVAILLLIGMPFLVSYIADLGAITPSDVVEKLPSDYDPNAWTQRNFLLDTYEESCNRFFVAFDTRVINGIKWRAVDLDPGRFVMIYKGGNTYDMVRRPLVIAKFTKPVRRKLRNTGWTDPRSERIMNISNQVAL
jgi:hypothetical protein